MNLTQRIILDDICYLRNDFYRTMNRHLRPYQLTFPQFEILRRIHLLGKLSIGEIQKMTGSTKGTTPVLIKHLEAAGLVNRNPQILDHRVKEVSLTQKGNQLIRSLAFGPYRDWVQDFFTGLDSETEESLHGLLATFTGIRRDREP